MGKIKVHELAKELGLQSKELVDKLISLKYNIKSHLSTLEDDEVEKIKKQLKKSEKTEKNVDNKKAESSAKKEKKPIAPVIIRREVTRVETVPDDKKDDTPIFQRNDIGVVQRRTDTSMNIKYRTAPKRPNIIVSKKEEPKNTNTVQVNEVKQPNPSEAIIEKKPEAPAPKTVETKTEIKNENVNTNNTNANAKTNSNANSYQKPNNNFRKDDKKFNNKPQDMKKPRPNNNWNENKKNDNKQDNRNQIADIEAPTKEPARATVNTGYKDKQKANRKFEEESNTKKNAKGKNSRDREEINMGKLKDLQTENNFSSMFNDTESKMFDYYDLSRGKGFKKNKKKATESKNHVDQKIFELTDIEIGDSVTVKELAEKLKKQSSEVIKKLMGYGIMATLNNELDYDTAFLVASEFGVNAHKKEVVSDEDILFDETEDKEEDLIPRPPIVVVMGHVDHGKTSLLDAIRSTNVIDREAGGITQHIGAYKVKINDREITFLDTPGHEAFTAMRARGAQVTDIAIIIVAANDGIMPQTVEAINHAKAAGVSIIVAINKVDLPEANVDKVKQELTEYGLVPEEWGGDTICVPISAKQHKNIDSLLEMVLLVADMKDLKSNPDKQAKGTVLEARLDKNTGITASLLVQRGTLNIGDTIVVGSVIGKIRGMTDDKGQKVKSAGPSTPVEVIGLPEVPEAGEIFYEVENEKVAKHLIEKRKSKQREDMIRRNAPVTLDNLFSQIEEGKLKDLNIIIKADVQGSAQALRQSLEKIQNEEARVRIIHSNVGGITESDVTLAKVTNSIVIGFNVRPEPIAKSIAEKEGVQIKIYSVIYNAIDDVTAALKGMLQPKYREVIQGTAEVRQVFKITNVGMIAGCYVIDGKIVRNSGVRVIRDNVVIHEGKLVSLKREKNDVKDVAVGYECGVQVEEYNDIKIGDHIESFIMEEIKQN